MKGHRNGYRRGLQALLHNLVTTSLPHGGKSILFQYPANIQARENPQPTQPVPQPE
jgi:hypothetical protein